MKFNDFLGKYFNLTRRAFAFLFKIIAYIFHLVIRLAEAIFHSLFLVYLLIGNFIYCVFTALFFIHDDPVFVITFSILLSMVFIYSWFTFKRYYVFRKSVKAYVFLSFLLFAIFIFCLNTLPIKDHSVTPVFIRWVVVLLPVICFAFYFFKVLYYKCPKCPFIIALGQGYISKNEFISSRKVFNGYDRETTSHGYEYSYTLRKNVMKETVIKTSRYRTVNKYRLYLKCKNCGYEWTKISEE